MKPIPRSVRLSAYLCFAQAALATLLVCGGSYLLSVILRWSANSPGVSASNTAIRSGVMIASLACLGVPFILALTVAGIGVLRCWRWARWMAIIVSAIACVVGFPIGTALGVPVIIMLMQSEAQQAFKKISPTVP